MKNNIHHEFAYQSRELGAQIEDTWAIRPTGKIIRGHQSLLGEFAKGAAIDDVNLLSFCPADYLRFDDPAGLLAQCRHYDVGDAAKVMAMVSCADAGPAGFVYRFRQQSVGAQGDYGFFIQERQALDCCRRVARSPAKRRRRR